MMFTCVTHAHIKNQKRLLPPLPFYFVMIPRVLSVGVPKKVESTTPTWGKLAPTFELIRTITCKIGGFVGFCDKICDRIKDPPQVEIALTVAFPSRI